MGVIVCFYDVEWVGNKNHLLIIELAILQLRHAGFVLLAIYLNPSPLLLIQKITVWILGTICMLAIDVDEISAGQSLIMYTSEVYACMYMPICLDISSKFLIIAASKRWIDREESRACPNLYQMASCNFILSISTRDPVSIL